MVYIELNGRVGNHLFQIAAGASLAKMNNTNFRVVCHRDYKLSEPDNCYIEDYIKQFGDNLYKKIINENKRPAHYLLYNEPSYNYSPIPYSDNILLHGTFQSYKYFDINTVSDLFKIPIPIKTYIESKYGGLIKKGITSINVRRGDYCTQPHKYPICGMYYFKKAINRIGTNKKYLIISDDIDWCRNNFRGNNFYFIDNEEPIVDLYIQSMCENNIMSNSTFSWWGAWLNSHSDKIVIYPTPWYGKSAYTKLDISDLIPQEWIKIENRLSLKLKLLEIALLIRENIGRLLPVKLKKMIKSK